MQQTNKRMMERTERAKGIVWHMRDGVLAGIISDICLVAVEKQ